MGIINKKRYLKQIFGDYRSYNVGKGVRHMSNPQSKSANLGICFIGQNKK